MAKAKTKPKSNPKNRWLIISGIVLLAGLVYFARDLYLDYQDREKFKRLEVAAESLNSQLVSGRDLELSQSRKFCHYAEQKWQQGPLICSIVYNYGYGNLDYTEVLKWFTNKELATIHQVVEQGSSTSTFSVTSQGDLCTVSFFKDDFQMSCVDTARTSHYPLSSR